MKIQTTFLVAAIFLATLTRGFSEPPPSCDNAEPSQGPAKNHDRLSAVTYGRGLFVAVGDSGAILTSPNGSWVSRASSLFNTTSGNFGNIRLE